MSQTQQQEHLHNMSRYRRQTDIGTYWSASVKVRRQTVSKEAFELQVRSLFLHMQLSPWLTKKLNELLELNAQRA